MEILEVAEQFAKMVPTTTLNDEETIDGTLVPVSTDRHRHRPILHKCSTSEELISYVLEEIESYLYNEKCRLSDFGVLYSDCRFHNFPIASLKPARPDSAQASRTG